MLKILVDGEPAHLYTNGRFVGKQLCDPNVHAIEVIWEFEEDLKGSEISHRFTQEGCIVEGRQGITVLEITHGLWDQLAEDGGMI